MLVLCVVASLGAAAPVSVRSAPGLDTFVMTVDGDVATCRQTSSVAVPVRDEDSLHVITPESTAKTGPGLTIVLRGTDQLEQYPQAKAAFVRAAGVWEQTITATPITIIVDVDFGPTFFGQPFPSNVLGATNPQLVLLPSNYTFIRSHLRAAASSDEERALYDTLPERAVPTDLGSTGNIYAPSPILRALRFLGPVAKPRADEERGLGPPPSIAISSAFAFDFDASNGIGASDRDFEAVVLHELGHVLGFTSAVGAQESSPTFPVAVSVLDLFRFRPGVTAESFASARRVLSSGGEQVFYARGATLPLSTGRQDATGGDGRQASHWKDEALGGEFVGLMHPALKQGVHETLTANDLLAFDRIGYTLEADPPGVVASLAAELRGEQLVFTGTLATAPLDIRTARITLLSGEFREIHTSAPFAVSLGETTEFSVAFDDIDLYPEALAARLTLFDAAGVQVGSGTADFSAGDAGGPEIKRATFRSRTLKITGSGFASESVVEVRGAPIPTGIEPKINNAGTRVTIRADSFVIGLRPGFNRVRVIAAGLRSNLVVVPLD